MKRTSLLCVLAGVLILSMALPALAVDWPLPPVSYPGHVALYKVGVQNPGSDPVPQAPAFIDYTLNAKADITIEILPSDSAGVPTGDPAVRTETLYDQAKGHHLYLWPCVLDDLETMAPVGYYIARISATSVSTQWDANIGLYINWEIPTDGRWSCPPKDEWGYRGQAYDTAGNPLYDTAGNPILTVYYPRDTVSQKDETIGGFYGIAVNKNVGSPYYGRIYACHQTNRDIYVYDVDGTYLGKLDDTGVTWMTSSPWDMVIAEDDYIYVSDRTQMTVNCFQPSGGADGVGVIKSISGQYTNDRGMGGGWVDTAGVTHFVISSGQYLYPFTLAANHTTWSARGAAIINVGATDQLYGECYDTTHNIIYTACIAGTYKGVRKWNKVGSTWTVDSAFKAPKNTAGGNIDINCVDVEIASYDSAGAPDTLWITGNSASNDNLFLCSAKTGVVIERTSDLVNYGFMLCGDGVGNVLVGFGKSATSWPSKYFGMFSHPGTFTAQVDTGAFYVPSDPAPVLVGGSESWTYGDFSGELIPDEMDTAELSFQVIDANGFSDIGDIQLDIKELRDTSDTTTISPDSITQASALVADVTVNLWARRGTQYGTRSIGMKAYDSDQPTKYTSGSFSVAVAGNEYRAVITHTRTGAYVSEAAMKFVGGKPGIYGYPFTYTSGPSDATGNASCFVSEGDFSVTAEKVGYKTQAAKTVASPMVQSGAMPVNVTGGLQLGPLSIAEARLLTNQAVYCSIEGLTYARPKGVAPTAANGLDDRIDSQTDAVNTTWCRQFYLCDANDAGSGLECQLLVPSSSFNRQWDDTAGKIATPPFTSTYIGRRPVEGETLCMSGWLETRPGYETRFKIDDEGLKVASPTTYKQYYYNLTQYGIVPSTTLPTPVTMQIPRNASTGLGIAHANNATYEKSWGKFGSVAGCTVVRWMPDGTYFWETPSGNVDTVANKPARYVAVADTLGNWSTVTFQSLTTLGIPPTGSDLSVPPMDLGDTYTVVGAAGRHTRFSVGTIRPRGTADITKTDDVTMPDANSVGLVRGMSTGSVAIRGIVTAKFAASTAISPEIPACIYVENADRSVGVRVLGNPTWVNVGDEVMVVGDVAVVDGIKEVIPSQAIAVLSTGHAMPYLGMRLHDVGGKDYGPDDPGITDGRGALNVGLLVNVSGIVTYRDTAATPKFFYIWDGSNMVPEGGFPQPLQDGIYTRMITKNPDGTTRLGESGDPEPIEVPVLGLKIAHSGWIGRAPVLWQDWVDIEGVVGVEQTGGKTIPVIFPKTVTLRTSFGTFSADADTVYTSGENVISLPAIPAKTGNGKDYQYYSWDWSELGYDLNPMGWDPQVVFGNKERWQVNACLKRTEAANTGEVPFWDSQEPLGVFGGMLLGDGYWVMPNDMWGDNVVSFSGIDQAIPQWIGTGAASWMQIGTPQNKDSRVSYWDDNGTPDNWDDDFVVYDADVYMTDGGAVHNLEEVSARNLDWLNSLGWWIDNLTKNQWTIGTDDDVPFTTTMSPWIGYFFEMHQTDKAWIIYPGP